MELDGDGEEVRFAAFDIETERLFHDGESAGDVPIALVTVVLCSDSCQFVWKPKAEAASLSHQDVRDVIDTLWTMSMSHTLVTWSGTNSDWPLLSAACGGSQSHITKCAQLAVFSVDIPLIVLARKGFMIGLAACTQGMGLGESKPIASVTAPALWAEGKRDQVVELCVSDAQNTLKIANLVQASGVIKWQTRRGKLKELELNAKLHLRRAIECPEIRPLPEWRWDLTITPSNCFRWMSRFNRGYQGVAKDPFASLPTWDEWHKRNKAKEGSSAASPPPPSPPTPPTPSLAAHDQRIALTMTPILTSPAALPTTRKGGRESPTWVPLPPPMKRSRSMPPAAMQRGRLFAAAIAGIDLDRY